MTGVRSEENVLFEHYRKGLVLLQVATTLRLEFLFWFVSPFDELSPSICLLVHVVSLNHEVIRKANALAFTAFCFWLRNKSAFTADQMV
jgi:hypothetical protein